MTRLFFGARANPLGLVLLALLAFTIGYGVGTHRMNAVSQVTNEQGYSSHNHSHGKGGTTALAADGLAPRSVRRGGQQPPFYINNAFRRVGYQISGATTASPLLNAKTARDERYDTVVDIGAFDGADYTIPAYHKGYTVYSFEPSKNNRDRLLKNIEANGWKRDEHYTYLAPTAQDTEESLRKMIGDKRAAINYKPHLFVIAAGCGKERATFVIGQSNEFAEVLPIAPGAAVPAGAETIEIVSVKSIVPDDARIFVFKIDTQGHEQAVFEGTTGVQLFDRVRTLAIEFWPKGLRDHGGDPLHVLQLLYGEYGFECYDMGTYEKAVPASRNGEIGAFIKLLSDVPTSFDRLTGWEDLMCV